MTPVVFLVAVAASMPTMDLPAVCRGERTGIAADQQASAYQGCLHDEQAAQAELRQNWTAYPAAARENCAQLGGIIGSYVEMLVCIEIKTGNAAGKSQQPPAAASP
jgi:hypothetical protein